MALLSINRFELPSDVITIIKSFAFYDIEMANILHIKNMNIRRIGCAYTNKHYADFIYGESYSPNHYWCRVPGELKWMNCVFCKRCGNYRESFRSMLREVIHCHCP